MWVSELGGVTFQLGSGDAREFIKILPAELAALWQAGDYDSRGVSR